MKVSWNQHYLQYDITILSLNINSSFGRSFVRILVLSLCDVDVIMPWLIIKFFVVVVVTADAAADAIAGIV